MAPEDLIRMLVLALVDEPHTVFVTAVMANNGVVVRVRVSARDVGKLIGTGGRTARSLRIVLSAMGEKLGGKYLLDIG